MPFPLSPLHGQYGPRVKSPIHPLLVPARPIYDFATEALALGPVLYARAGDVGTTLADSSGNGNNGASVGSVTFGVTGSLPYDTDKAVTLAGGIGDYLSFPTSASLDLADTAQSWVVRYSRGDLNGDGNLHFKAGSAVLYVNFDGSIDITVNGVGAVMSVSGPDDSLWHTLAVTKNSGGTDWRVYIDGVRKTGTMTARSTGGNGNATLFGSNALTQGFTGSMDELLKYGKALTDAEIFILEQAIGYAPVVVASPNMVADVIAAISNLPTAALTTVIQLVGNTIPAVSNLPTAALTTAIRMAGTIPAVSNLPTATLTTVIRLVGNTIAAISGTTGALNEVAAALAGVISAVTTTIGSLTTGGAAVDYRTTVLADAPIAYWRLGEASGATAVDETGTHHGVYVGSPGYGSAGALAGDANTAISFNVTERVTGSTGQLISALTASSVEFWFKGTSNNRAIYVERAGSGQDIWKICTQASGMTNWGMVHRNDAGTLTFTSSNTTITNGAYHHVVVTKSGTAIKFYVDGAAAGTATLNGSDTLTNAGLESWIGMDKGDAAIPLVGTLDEVAVYNYELAASQVTAHYGAGTSIRLFGLVSALASLAGTLTSLVVVIISRGEKPPFLEGVHLHPHFPPKGTWGQRRR